MAPRPLSLRPATAEEYASFSRTTERAFGFRWDPQDAELHRPVVELDRTLAAFDGGQPVATAAVFSFEMSVPGAVVPAAGVTGIGVLPSHRRRGLLSAIMARQLADLHDAGREPFAALWASEAGIYARFGYGMASQRASLMVPTAHARFRPDAPDPGPAALLEPDEAIPQLAHVWDGALAQRAGRYRRGDAWWHRLVADPPAKHRGRSELRAAVVSDADGPSAYALYRVRAQWTDGLPDGDVEVVEIIGRTPAGYVAVWRHLLGVDLVARVRADVQPVDDALLHALVDPRRARMLVGDGLWVRVVDVAAALAARRYARDVSVTLDVVDEQCPWNAGRWRLDAGPDGASCQRSDAPADVTVPVDVLGATYLGGTRWSALAAAARVDEHRPGAVRALNDAFAADPLPHCPEVF